MMRETAVRPGRNKNTKAEGPKIIIGSVDFIMLFVVILLVIIGTIMIFSASYYSAGDSAAFNHDIYYFLKRHLMYLVIGLFLLIILSIYNYRNLRNLAIIGYVASIVFLVLVLFVGTEINGAKRWLWFFQPSEVAKLGLILYLAAYIDMNKGILSDRKGFFKCVGIIAIPTGLIAIENMSTAIVIAAIGMGMLFVATPNIKLFYPLIPIGGLVVILGIIKAKFRLGRILAWIDPFAYAEGKGYQAVQSFYAIASGGFWGLGLGHSRQKLGYIPEAHNDIIFSIICEELGFFGAAIIVILFMMLIWRVIRCAMSADSEFGTLVASGIIIMIAVQVIINIAVVTNTIPNTGIPLPFISYGGTSLIIMLMSMGIVLNISKFRKG